VGKDTKSEHRAALARHMAVAESEVSSQTKSRKKRNRRNRDRAASSATLDFRSTSCSAVREDDKCPKNPISETKSFHASDKVTSKEKPAAGSNKQLSHGRSDRVPDTFSCRSSAGDVGRDGMMRQLAKDELKPAPVASLCPGNMCTVRVAVVFWGR